jgi:hypothetical protein
MDKSAQTSNIECSCIPTTIVIPHDTMLLISTEVLPQPKSMRFGKYATTCQSYKEMKVKHPKMRTNNQYICITTIPRHPHVTTARTMTTTTTNIEQKGFVTIDTNGCFFFPQLKQVFSIRLLHLPQNYHHILKNKIKEGTCHLT